MSYQDLDILVIYLQPPGASPSPLGPPPPLGPIPSSVLTHMDPFWTILSQFLIVFIRINSLWPIFTSCYPFLPVFVRFQPFPPGFTCFHLLSPQCPPYAAFFYLGLNLIAYIILCHPNFLVSLKRSWSQFFYCSDQNCFKFLHMKN